MVLSVLLDIIVCTGSMFSAPWPEPLQAVFLACSQLRHNFVQDKKKLIPGPTDYARLTLETS